MRHGRGFASRCICQAKVLEIIDCLLVPARALSEGRRTAAGRKAAVQKCSCPITSRVSVQGTFPRPRPLNLCGVLNHD
jgi:hypothetical protein